MSLRKRHPILKLLNSSLVDLPSPSRISYFWNFGSLLGLCLLLQILTGLFLAFHYTADISLAFSRVSHICRDVNFGWLLRNLHLNGARIFFVCLYFHIGRGIFFGSFKFHFTWMTGVVIFLLTMITAFLGYVLPWGQMSFWGATVITNLVSAVPYVGSEVVQWLWGGFSVDNPTLTRFFSFHFLFPFIILGGVLVHLIFLHERGSGNPLGVRRDFDKVPFHPYFTLKDLLGVLFLINFLVVISLLFPNTLSDPENCIPANPLVTPVHIQPEWYFLFAYAILRSIPNKLGGVIALVLSVLILILLRFSSIKKRAFSFSIENRRLFWSLVNVFILLTWIGARPVEFPYIFLGQTLSILYFSLFLLFFLKK